MSDLYEKLTQYSKIDWYPFHMPGHKRRIKDGINPYLYDITEIDGFDNLHEPEEIIKEEMKVAMQFYQSDATYFLVNGSTCGLLSAICALTSKGEKILVARNCHKSVYHAIFLNELQPIYIYPEYIDEFGINGGISPEVMRDILDRNRDIHVVIITSPTYEGVVSDIKTIADIVHERGAVLIVDEAHGAHFGMHEIFPVSALRYGADVVIQSVHKTLPSLTQTALLHIKGDRANLKEVERYLHIYQTSSPSYVLLSSITRCIKMAQESMGNGLFDKYAARLKNFYKQSENFNNIQIIQDNIKGKNSVHHFDMSKIVISVKNSNLTAKSVYQRLRNHYHLQLEMCAGDYMIAMTSFIDTDEGFERLYKALEEIDESINDMNHNNFDKDMFWNNDEKKFCKKNIGKESGIEDNTIFRMPQAIVLKKTSDAIGLHTKMVELKDAKGRMSAEYIYLYPPGIPVVAPGEMITGEVIELIKNYRRAGLDIHGTEVENAQYITIADVYSPLSCR